ncbi:conserved hypothetical protein [Deferribacter desulfuricans SSM1]|uniref:Lipopolysaccharide assembly protein A domain-containing protein n=1 Tax=Deferribacter desulfuricans (strain DSM 14783 / JCM 11476 / NBRC 101012 / SSM1) TaxID=639282 RepID=D3P8T6_DEFDS|nr:conserved hypothetical protein [Deferribacter desulfuricans SSM1]
MSRITTVWLFLFILGFIFINYPFITIFDKRVFIFGIPLIYLYFFIGWFGSILVVYVFVLFLRKRKQ